MAESGDSRRAQLEQWRRERLKNKATAASRRIASQTTDVTTGPAARRDTALRMRRAGPSSVSSSASTARVRSRTSSVESASASASAEESSSVTSFSAEDTTTAATAAVVTAATVSSTVATAATANVVVAEVPTVVLASDLVTPQKQPTLDRSDGAVELEAVPVQHELSSGESGSSGDKKTKKRRKSYISPSPFISSLAGGAQRVVTPTRLMLQQTEARARRSAASAADSDGGFDTPDEEEKAAFVQLRVADATVVASALLKSSDNEMAMATSITVDAFSSAVSESELTTSAATSALRAISEDASSEQPPPRKTLSFGPLRVLRRSATIVEEEAGDAAREQTDAVGALESRNSSSSTERSRSETLPAQSEPRIGAPQRVAVRSSAPTALNATLPLVGRTFKTSLSNRKSLDDAARPLRSLSERLEERRNFEMEDFVVTKSLGKGKFGNVYLAKERHSNVTVALKVLFKSPLIHEGGIQNLKREVEIHLRLDHPNIIRLYGHFYDDSCVYLVLEYATHGELYKQLTKQTHFSEPTAAHYVAQVVDALRYCHDCNVIHRDIKPENLLLGANQTVKLADFGWSVHAPKPKDKRRTVCGTPEYLSPEMLLGRAHSFATDAWSLGVLTYELLVGAPPFNCENQMEMYKRIEMVDYTFPDTPTVSPAAKSFIGALLQFEPEARMTLATAAQHPWLRNRLPI